MTAPDARQSDELREAVMDVVSSVLSLYIGDDLPCAMTATVDALLPVVTAWHEKAAEAQARARAAEELRKAAKAWEALVQREKPPMRGSVWLTDRATALAADDRTDPA